MDIPQTSTQSEPVLDVSPENVELNKPLEQKQEEFISFKAVSGLIVEVGEDIKSMNLTEFAKYVGVDRKTLYNWQKSIPNFWERVKQRRQAIFSRDRVSKVWSRVYLDAVSGKAEQQKLFLGQFADWKPPAQAHEVQMTGWGDVINQARRLKRETDSKQTGVIDLT